MKIPNYKHSSKHRHKIHEKGKKEEVLPLGRLGEALEAFHTKTFSS